MYLLALLVWIAAGWPRAIAAASGFDMVPGYRALLGLGLASIFSCCIFLAGRRRQPGASALGLAAIAGAVALPLALLCYSFNRATDRFAGLPQIVFVCVLGAAAAICLQGSTNSDSPRACSFPTCFSTAWSIR